MVLPERLLNDKIHARLNMVNGQLRSNGVRETRLIQAFESVPMEVFVPPSIQPLAYSDADLPLTLESGSSKRWLLAPLTLGKLLQLADIQPSDKVLVVGCGSGYSLALITQLAAYVVGVESDEDLAHTARMYELEEDTSRVHVVVGALSVGYPKEAPYDVILIEGAVGHIPQILAQQLAPHGRLVTILKQQTGQDPRNLGKGVMIKKNEDVVVQGLMQEWVQESKFDASAHFLPEFEPVREFCL